MSADGWRAQARESFTVLAWVAQCHETRADRYGEGDPLRGGRWTEHSKRPRVDGVVVPVAVGPAADPNHRKRQLLGREHDERMKNFSLIANLSGVTGAVVGDTAGTVIEHSGSIDAESTSAILAFITQSLTLCGEQLGLGPLTQAVVSSPVQNCLVTVTGEEVVGVCLDASKPMAAFEKNLYEILQR